ncbi:MAG: sensor histidine kinase, partial [Desulfobacula sp.]|nr:sensor histidine kinase [Desulfobacula sp.]
DIQLDLEKVPLVCIPVLMVERAVNAILDNAFQAVSSQGIISVSCQYLDPNIIICISDLGCGISKEDLPHIFSPYFTGNKKEGKGLGLAFARSVILNCNGDIKITSSRNEGTTVRIILPIKNDPSLQ